MSLRVRRPLRGAARQRARARVRRRHAGRAGSPLLPGAGVRAPAAATTGRGPGAHGSALPRPRCAVSEAARRAARPLVHALARGTDAAAGDSTRGHHPQRRPAFLPPRLAEGAGDRPRDRRLAVRAAARPARRPRPLRLLALGRTARWKGYDTMLAALELAVASGIDAELELRGPQLTDDERAHRRELEAAVAASDVLRPRVRIELPVPRTELPRPSRGHGRAPERDAAAGERDARQGGLRGGRLRRARRSRATPRSTSSSAAFRWSSASLRATPARSPTGCVALAADGA